jgi:hypothetical protein
MGHLEVTARNCSAVDDWLPRNSRVTRHPTGDGACRNARATAPTTGARTPRAAGRICGSAVALGIPHRRTDSRMGASPSSPASASSPPISIRSGLKQIAQVRLQSHPRLSTSVGQHQCARVVTPRLPDDVGDRQTGSESRLQKFDHRSCGHQRLQATSPAVPLRPWNSSPLIINPAPTPSDSFRKARLLTPLPAGPRQAPSYTE